MTKEINKELITDLKHKKYGIFGKHSAVEICTWNKKALRGEGVCYKEHFYNVNCHRCAQITPSVLWCHQNCTFCWRPAQYMDVAKLDLDFIDNPKEIIDGLFIERKKLLSGFGGFKKVDKKKLKEAEIPSHVAISLSGEPTLYPKLDEMIIYLKSLKQIKTIFLVTNGQEPKMLKKLQEKKALPTQIYLSIDAPTEELYLKINRPKIKDGWKNLQKTVSLFKDIKTRRVIRFTLIKGLNDDLTLLKKYIKLFEKTDADFLEIKSYMFLGYSRKTLALENMPSHQDCLDFAKLVENNSKKFKIVDECKPSRIVLLKNKNSKYKNFILTDKEKERM